ncbi:MAG TPA: 5-oxoprolinase subunit PxpA [Bryobacteraceae bacterium]|nr:5-oxoprolinase subunit PxpA [Bryobacteraceae bacterium]
MRLIDLNCDAGELEGHAIPPFVTSVNIACGGHAGDGQMMEATLRQALTRGIAVGAHPSYPDRANFGRVSMRVPCLRESIFGQIESLARVAQRCGAHIAHVKPHGALYNDAARDAGLARDIAEAVAHFSREVVLVGLAGSVMLDIFRDAGFRTAAEAFADRAYEPDGTLRARRLPGALIEDPEEAARHALEIVDRLQPDTLCIHGDTPGAEAIAAAVAFALRRSGFELRSLGVSSG